MTAPRRSVLGALALAALREYRTGEAYRHASEDDDAIADLRALMRWQRDAVKALHNAAREAFGYEAASADPSHPAEQAMRKMRLRCLRLIARAERP